jgi:hypothetical protein
MKAPQLKSKAATMSQLWHQYLVSHTYINTRTQARAHTWYWERWVTCQQHVHASPLSMFVNLLPLFASSRNIAYYYSCVHWYAMRMSKYALTSTTWIIFKLKDTNNIIRDISPFDIQKISNSRVEDKNSLVSRMVHVYLKYSTQSRLKSSSS